MSDHLPVVSKFLYGNNLSIDPHSLSGVEIRFQNPVSGTLELFYNCDKPQKMKIEIYSELGIAAFTAFINLNNSGSINIPTENLKSGLYIMRVFDSQNRFMTKKLIVL